MSGWVHWQKPFFAGFAPDDQWQVSTSANGVDVVSPAADSDASFAFASSASASMTPSDVRDGVLGQAGFGSVQVMALDQPHPFQSFTRQSFEFTAQASGGRVQGSVHGVITADASGGGFDAYLVFAHDDVWDQSCGTLVAIRNHITYLPTG